MNQNERMNSLIDNINLIIVSIHITQGHLSRYAAGKSDPNGPSILQIITALVGDALHLSRLAGHLQMTVVDAEHDYTLDPYVIHCIGLSDQPKFMMSGEE